MKNSDMPAMPIELNGYGQYAPEALLGLTKREHFAGLAMQGILSSLESKVGMEALAVVAVHMADALLAELEK